MTDSVYSGFAISPKELEKIMDKRIFQLNRKIDYLSVQIAKHDHIGLKAERDDLDAQLIELMKIRHDAITSNKQVND